MFYKDLERVPNESPEKELFLLRNFVTMTNVILSDIAEVISEFDNTKTDINYKSLTSDLTSFVSNTLDSTFKIKFRKTQITLVTDDEDIPKASNQINNKLKEFGLHGEILVSKLKVMDYYKASLSSIKTFFSTNFNINVWSDFWQQLKSLLLSLMSMFGISSDAMAETFDLINSIVKIEKS